MNKRNTSLRPLTLANQKRDIFSFLIEPMVIVLALFIPAYYYHGEISNFEFLAGILAISLNYPGEYVALKGTGGKFLSMVANWFVCCVILFALAYGGGFLHYFDQTVLWIWVTTVPFALFFTITVINLIIAKLFKTQNRRAIVVGANDIGQRLATELTSQTYNGIDFCGYLDDRHLARLGISAESLLGSISQVAEIQKNLQVNEIYIALPMGSTPRILKLLEDLRDTTASIYFVPDIFVYDLIQARIDSINGLPVVAVCESPFHGINGLTKRVCDFIFAFCMLIGLSPILLIISVGVKLSSPGPIIFKQRRYGLDGKEILVWKFRSLKVTEDGKGKFTAVSKDDQRLTKFGSFIRKTSLDELPQLVNVLFGSMSVVGPRPHAVMMNEHYRKLIPGYMVRHKVKPGITGWAQVNGYRGGDDLESMKKRIEYDLEYLRNWSLALDFNILIKTITVVFADRTAY